MIKIFNYNPESMEKILNRSYSEADVSGAVREIIENVVENGDKALFEYCEKFDGAKLTALRVSEEEMAEALSQVSPEFIGVLKKSAANIRKFHEKQLRKGFEISDTEGIVIGQKVIPIENVGLYVPGGTAAYPSTVLMDAIPAKIAGVKRLVMVSPVKANGKIKPDIAAAAAVAGVDEIYKVGGAQAVAALAYGTESIPKVDKIVGPGNAFVAEAKRQVFGRVSIDMIAGPSEILIVADEKSDARILAADMLSQAEHDKLATAVLITDSEELALKTAAELEKQLKTLPREEIARASIENNGKIIIVDNIEEGIDAANALAPEHFELSVDEPFKYLDLIKHAGSVFLGRNCPEALGDYYAGPNHTLPTGGSARFSNPLSVDDFVKKTQFTYYTKDALEDAYKDIAFFARREGLDAHARSVEARFTS